MRRSKWNRRGIAVLVICTAAGLLRAADPHQWRFWGVRDGLAETYTIRISLTPDGDAYARHGAVRSMSVFDGYGITLLPEARLRTQPFWPAESRVSTCPGCTPWVASEGELREFTGGKWVTHYKPPEGEKLVGAAPTGDHVV